MPVIALGSSFRPFVLIALTVVLSIATASPAVASHSLPNVPRYWDCNNDGLADDGCVKGYKAGTGWGAFNNAGWQWGFDQWSDNTDFDPQAYTSGQAVYVDDRATCLTEGDGHLSGTNILAITCTTATWRFDSYWDIGTAKIYFNPDVAFHSGPTLPPPPGTYSFHGVLTHELGHWVFLRDLSCDPGPTMCGTANLSETYDISTLATDDINAANAVYP